MTGQENPAGFYALYIVRSYRYSVHTTQIFVVNSLPVAQAIVFSLLTTFTINLTKPSIYYASEPSCNIPLFQFPAPVLDQCKLHGM